MTAKELGFDSSATTEEIYTRANELGLGLCPAEVGPQLRWQYSDQPKNKWLFVAMESIEISIANFHVFGLMHDEEGCWLFTNPCRPSDVFDADFHWVFTCSQQISS